MRSVIEKSQEKILKYLTKKYQSRETDLSKKLSTINESAQSIEKEDESSTGIQKGLSNKNSIQEFDMEFEVEPKDILLEKIEQIALIIDIHKCGVLYLEEIVFLKIKK